MRQSRYTEKLRNNQQINVNFIVLRRQIAVFYSVKHLLKHLLSFTKKQIQKLLLPRNYTIRNFQINKSFRFLLKNPQSVPYGNYLS